MGGLLQEKRGMKVFSMVLWATGIGLAAGAMPAAAEPSVSLAYATRAMSEQDCLKRARSALGEKGLKVAVASAAGAGGHLAGTNNDVTVVITCVGLDNGTLIHVIGTSDSGAVATQFRDSIKALVMGPPS